MTVLSAPQANGAAPALPHAERLVAELRQLIAEREARRDELRAELEHVTHELKAYEKAIAPLVADPHAPAGAGTKKAERVRKVGSKVGPERLAAIERVIREIADADPDGHFRQGDVRERMGLQSSVSSVAFRQLRDDNVIRLAGVEKQDRGQGVQVYRLTRPAERQQPPIRPPKAGTRDRVLDAIREHGPATFATIKEASGVSDVAVRNAVRTLQAEGVIRDAGTVQPRRPTSRPGGKRAHTYALAQEAGR